MVFLHVVSRKVWVSLTTYHPAAQWVNQQGRHALMWLEDSGIEGTHLIRDHDSKFPGSFDRLMDTAGIQIVKSPVQAPNANAFAEAWVASVKRECLNYFWCFSLRHLEHIVHRYSRFYYEHRPHQRLGNRVLRFPHEPLPKSQSRDGPTGRIGCRSGLGGLLKHYCRCAA